MSEFNYRVATLEDIPFLVKTIVEAEKSGTEVLSYSAIFGLSIGEVEEKLAIILDEEIDDCELSVSSFLVAEKEGKIAGALSGWIEGNDGVPSAVLKGNLLGYHFPKESLIKAASISSLLNEIHIECFENTVQIGAGYVAEEYRGHSLLGKLSNEIIRRCKEKNPNLNEAYVHVFDCNIPSLKTFGKAGFQEFSFKESNNLEIANYLPSAKKILLKQEI